MSAAATVSKLVASLTASTSDEEALRATSELAELIRGHEHPQELANTFFDRVLRSTELYSQSNQRRAFARYLDAFVDRLGAECCTERALSVLVTSICQVAVPTESIVASEVLLGILSQGLARAWDLVWTSYADGQSPGLLSLLVEAMDRSPEYSVPRVVTQLKNVASRFPSLELLCAAGQKSSSLFEREAFAAVLATLFSIMREDDVPRNVGTAIVAVVIITRTMDSARFVSHFGDFSLCLGRALRWKSDEKAPLSSSILQEASALLFFHLYCVCPEQTLSWAREERDVAFQNALTRVMRSQHMVLHPGLVLWNEEQRRAPPPVEECWALVFASSSLRESASVSSLHDLLDAEAPASSSTSMSFSGSSHPPPLPPGGGEDKTSDVLQVVKEAPGVDTPQEQEDWMEALDDLEERMIHLSSELDALALRTGVRPFGSIHSSSWSSAISPSETRSYHLFLRNELLFERLLRLRLLCRMREEGAVGKSGLKRVEVGGGGGGGVGGSVGGAGAVAAAVAVRASGMAHLATTPTTTDDDGVATSTASEKEDVPEDSIPTHVSENKVLRALLAAARREIAARARSEDELHQRLHALEMAKEESAAGGAVGGVARARHERPVDSSQDRLCEQENRILALEGELADAKSRLRDQHAYEVELADLQFELAQWEEAHIALQVAQDRGRDAQARADAAQAHIASLEHAISESRSHYHATLMELSAMTSDVNAAKSEKMRVERERDAAKDSMEKVSSIYGERLAAVESKYAVLQDLHLGLQKQLLEVQKASKKGTTTPQ